MCRPNIYRQDLTDLDAMAATREERLRGAEESRRIHRDLWCAVRDAWTGADYREAKAAWDAHIEGHKASAARIRAGREK